MFHISIDSIVLKVSYLNNEVNIEPITPLSPVTKSIAQSEQSLAGRFIKNSDAENIEAALMVYFDSRGWIVKQIE
jgi:hypothetical protein